MMTYDINIPIEETLMITKSLLLIHNDAQVTKQIITLLEVILQQNYCSFGNILYQTEKGVSMGSHVSNTIAEILLQYIEDTYLKQLLDTKKKKHNPLYKICRWYFTNIWHNMHKL